VKPPRPSGLAIALWALSALARAAAGESGEPQVRIELGPEKVSIDGTAQLVLGITIEGSAGVAFEPAFELENLESVAGPGSTRISEWVNGRATSGRRLTWRLKPLALGSAAVRNVHLRYAGRDLALPDREIQVLAADQLPPRPAPRGLDPFDALMGEDPFAPFRRRAPATLPKLRLSALASTQNAWVGEQIVWELVLDTQTDISSFRPRELPGFEGFWVRELPVPERVRPQTVEFEGDSYWRVASLRRALFPLRPGRFRLAPASADVVARIAGAGWAGPFAHHEQVALEAAPVEVEVRPLPKPPEGFAGAVGAVGLEAALEPKVAPVGVATTLSLDIVGFGNLSGIPPPRLRPPTGLRAFEPTSTSREEPVGDRLRTTLTWSWVVVGERPGRYLLELPEIVWFDPEETRYRVAKAPAAALEVVPAVAGTTAEAPQPPGTVPVAAPLSLAVAGGVLAGGLAVGLAVWAVSVVRRRSGPGRADRARLARRLLEASGERQPAAAAQALEAAWLAWLEERWGLPATPAPTGSRQRLVAGGLPPDTADSLIELFRELRDLRYAPELADAGSLLREAHERSNRLLRNLT